MHVMEDRVRVTQRERELGAIISAYNDVTERLKSAHERLSHEVSRLRDELKLKNTELRRRERLAALGQMAAGLAHEVRNPLGGIALYTSLLEQELADHPTACVTAGKIARGVQELERLVSAILDFAREFRLECSACRLGDLLSDLTERLEPMAAEYQATVTIEPSANDVQLWCDPTRLRQVLSNLLLNGLQAAGQGGHVWLSATERPGSGETQIEVWDDGPGIPSDQLDRIFNPFFTTRGAGTGLGLAIVHQIVEAHGGTIRAGNRAQGGAKFVLRLPASVSTAGAEG